MLENKQYTWLVTGSAGFIGSNLVNFLLDNNQKVVGLDNMSNGKKDNFPKKIQNFKFINGDIRSLDICMEASYSCDFILHQAAVGSVPRSFKDPITFNEINIGGFLNILIM